MAILLKAIYRFNALPIKIPTQFFTDFETTILNFVLKNRKSKMAKIILNNKGTTEGIHTPDFKFYFKAVPLKTAWY